LDSSYLDLPGSTIAYIAVQGTDVSVRFARAILIKRMTGSHERTRWWQAGSLQLSDVNLSMRPLEGPLTCTGGDLEDNIYTYRDMIPIPFSSRGRIQCVLRFEAMPEPFSVTAAVARLDMEDVPRYIEHIRS
jgi:hypothetical protein